MKLDLEGCELTDNRCSQGLLSRGGAIAIDAANAELTATGCVFQQNHAESGGGALTGEDAELTMIDCVFTDNDASSNGGAILALGSELGLRNCALRGNETSHQGGAIWTGDCHLSLVSCLVSGNLAPNIGGGIRFSQNSGAASLAIVNTTFTGNSASSTAPGVFPAGGGIHATGTSINAHVANSILWDNSSNGSKYLLDSSFWIDGAAGGQSGVQAPAKEFHAWLSALRGP